MRKKLNVGLVGMYQRGCDAESGLKNLRTSIKVLEELSQKEDFNFYPVAEGVDTPEEAAKARKEMEDKGVDFLLILKCTYGFGHSVVPLAHINARIGLWSLPDHPTEEFPLVASFCGMNMYSSIIGHYLKPYNIPFKWFYGMPESKVFLDRFRVTIRSLTALKSLASSRMCLVGEIVPGFTDMYLDERSFTARYGISIDHRPVSEVLKRAREQEKSKVADRVKKIRSEGKNRDVGNEGFDRTARVYLTLEEMARENSYDVLAIRCWPDFQTEYQLSVCSVLSLLNQSNITAACEADGASAISMLLLNYLNGGQSTLTDLLVFDAEDESVLMWHCGPSAKSWANEKGMEYRVHGHQKHPMLSNMVFAPGEVTMMRILDEGENMFLATGKITDKDKTTYEGAKGWVENMKMQGKPVSVMDLINTVIVERVPHHFPLAKGNLHNEIMEVASWLNIKPVEVVPHTQYMQNSQK